MNDNISNLIPCHLLVSQYNFHSYLFVSQSERIPSRSIKQLSNIDVNSYSIIAIIELCIFKYIIAHSFLLYNVFF